MGGKPAPSWRSGVEKLSGLWVLLRPWTANLTGLRLWNLRCGLVRYTRRMLVGRGIPESSAERGKKTEKRAPLPGELST